MKRKEFYYYYVFRITFLFFFPYLSGFLGHGINLSFLKTSFLVLQDININMLSFLSFLGHTEIWGITFSFLVTNLELLSFPFPFLTCRSLVRNWKGRPAIGRLMVVWTFLSSFPSVQDSLFLGLNFCYVYFSSLINLQAW